MTQSNSSSRQRINDLRTQIVALLNSENFVSGEEISRGLGITRSSVSNHIKAISELGLDIFSVKGRGYKLAKPLTLLSEGKIRQHMAIQSTSQSTSDILLRNIVSSTNDVVKQLAPSLKQGSVCLAECQTQGRGRRGRTWVSPFGSSIYMSMLWRFDSGYQSMAGLSLLIGIGLNRALQRLGVHTCKLKWPNDVYNAGKKLAGILIEVEGQIGEQTLAVIGVGVNIELADGLEAIDQAYTDVQEALGGAVDRNIFTAYLLEALWDMLPEFQQNGLAPFMEEWRAADLYFDKKVSLISGSYTTHGVSKGIDSSGALLLETNGAVKPYHGGEISVRPC
ncbi:bifunctional biotin--[acetyl-CoA-carboxylase] ligase/biotin operon repressor BirA [Glaciecola siphonariae]|uniref:Bifunctional ligase/repressor BirA n=1 Tax=Glaciecola siphonariae TaxID=521012 RepID=A0ABV9LZA8_9ALTE